MGQTVLQRSERLKVPIWVTAAAILTGSNLAMRSRECREQGRNNHLIVLAPYHLCGGALV